MKKYSKRDQRTLATWAVDCALRVLPLFEKAHPNDDRPRKAIKACRAWVRTGVFKMNDIRSASLAAHAAARAAKNSPMACCAARAAGQAVATAHIPQHAIGSAYYALKALAASSSAGAEAKVARERQWQSRRLAKHLREDLFERLTIEQRSGGISITLRKGKGF